MDKTKELEDRLEKIKRELAKKRKKLEKSRRAEKAKAHVHQKLKEHGCEVKRSYKNNNGDSHGTRPMAQCRRSDHLGKESVDNLKSLDIKTGKAGSSLMLDNTEGKTGKDAAVLLSPSDGAHFGRDAVLRSLDRAWFGPDSSKLAPKSIMGQMAVSEVKHNIHGNLNDKKQGKLKDSPIPNCKDLQNLGTEKHEDKGNRSPMLCKSERNVTSSSVTSTRTSLQRRSVSSSTETLQEGSRKCTEGVVPKDKRQKVLDRSKDDANSGNSALKDADNIKKVYDADETAGEKLQVLTPNEVCSGSEESVSLLGIPNKTSEFPRNVACGPGTHAEGPNPPFTACSPVKYGKTQDSKSLGEELVQQTSGIKHVINLVDSQSTVSSEDMFASDSDSKTSRNREIVADNKIPHIIAEPCSRRRRSSSGRKKHLSLRKRKKNFSESPEYSNMSESSATVIDSEESCPVEQPDASGGCVKNITDTVLNPEAIQTEMTDSRPDLDSSVNKGKPSELEFEPKVSFILDDSLKEETLPCRTPSPPILSSQLDEEQDAERLAMLNLSLPPPSLISPVSGSTSSTGSGRSSGRRHKQRKRTPLSTQKRHSQRMSTILSSQNCLLRKACSQVVERRSPICSNLNGGRGKKHLILSSIFQCLVDESRRHGNFDDFTLSRGEFSVLMEQKMQLNDKQSSVAIECRKQEANCDIVVVHSDQRDENLGNVDIKRTSGGEEKNCMNVCHASCQTDPNSKDLGKEHGTSKDETLVNPKESIEQGEAFITPQKPVCKSQKCGKNKEDSSGCQGMESPMLFPSQHHSSSAVHNGSDHLIASRASPAGMALTPGLNKDKSLHAHDVLDSHQVYLMHSGQFQTTTLDPLLSMAVGKTRWQSTTITVVACLATTSLTLWTQSGDHNWQCVHIHKITLKKNSGAKVYLLPCTTDILVILQTPASANSTKLQLLRCTSTQEADVVHLATIPSKRVCVCLLSEMEIVSSHYWNQMTYISKYVFDPDHREVKSELRMEEAADAVTSLMPVENLTSALIGLSRLSNLHIWNHSCGVHIQTVDLSDVCSNDSCCLLAYSDQGFLYLPVISRKRSKEAGALLVINPQIGTSETLFGYTAPADVGWPGSVDAAVLDDSCVVAMDTAGGVYMWDMMTGQLVGSVTDVHFTHIATHERMLAVGHKNCVHSYNMNVPEL